MKDDKLVLDVIANALETNERIECPVKVIAIINSEHYIKD